jgi:hypothetical protein
MQQENGRYELSLALRSVLRMIRRLPLKRDEEERCDAAEAMLKKHSKITDVLRTESNEQPVEQKEQVKSPNWDYYIPQMSNIQDRTGISLDWQKMWSEIETWYGDIKKKETGEQFLKRMQCTYFQGEQKENDAVDVDELWDEHSALIGDDIDDLSYWAGREVMKKKDFEKAIDEYQKQNKR